MHACMHACVRARLRAPQRAAHLQLRHQITRLGGVEGARAHEQHVVGVHVAVLSVHDAALHVQEKAKQAECVMPKAQWMLAGQHSAHGMAAGRD